MTETHAERVAELRAALEQRLPKAGAATASDGGAASVTTVLDQRRQPTLTETAQRLEDATARDQKIDFRVSQGERELWERAAQAKGIPTSQFVRNAASRAAEEALAAAYATE